MIVGCAIAFGLGLALRMLASSVPDSDRWGALWYVRQQEDHNWINLTPRDSVQEGIRGYPVFPHFLISRFPRESHGRVAQVFNVLWDLLVAALVMVGYLILEGPRDASPQKTLGLPHAVWAALLFLTMPILTPMNARVSGVGGRTLGLFLVTCYTGALGAGIITQNPLWYIPAAILGLFVVISSMFGLQAMVAMTLTLAAWTPSIGPLGVLLAVFAVSFLFPSIGAKDVLRHYIQHKIWYFRHSERGTTAGGRNRVQEYLTLPVVLISNPHDFLKRVATRLTFVIAAYSVPCFWVLLVFKMLGAGQAVGPASESGIEDLFWGMAFGGLFAFLFTSLPKFGFLGQAERYFEYATPAIAILAVITLGNSGTILVALVVLQVILCLAQIGGSMWATRFAFAQTASTDFRDALETLSQLPAGSAILAVPCKVAQLVSLKLDAHGFSYYYRFVCHPDEVGFSSFVQDTFGGLPEKPTYSLAFDVVTETPPDLARRYGITHVFVDKKFHQHLVAGWRARGMKNLPQLLYENDSYLLYAVRSA